MKCTHIIQTIAVLLTFIISFYGKSLLDAFWSCSLSSPYLRIGYFYLWWALPPILLLATCWSLRKTPDCLGLNRSPKTGLVVALICTAPMWLGGASAGQIATPIDWTALLHQTFIAGFFEEYLFRGFLFGLLFRKLKWGFLPAALMGSFFFGLGHLYQGATTAETVGIFLITALGALWFSWLYIEWDANLWVPIFLHSLMNFSWAFFDTSHNALGDLYANLLRTLTIAISIILTFFYHHDRGRYINKNNLLINSSEAKVP